VAEQDTLAASDMATMRDGAQIAYTLRRSATARAPRVVLIHTLWAPVMDLLPEMDVLTYDVRGHGESSKSAGPYTAAQFADDLADLLAGVGWERAVVVGGSMGGSIAIAFAVAHPDMVEALGLIDTTAWYGADAPTAWADRAAKAASDGFGSMIGFQVTRWYSDAFREANPAIVTQTSDIFLRSDLAAYTALCGMLGTFDERTGLPGIAVPTEVLVGEEDYATPVAMSRDLAATIPGANLTIVPNVRHLTIVEIPEQIAELIRTLVARAS
jgi:3-oxoadipate enol-lactonase